MSTAVRLAPAWRPELDAAPQRITGKIDVEKPLPVTERVLGKAVVRRSLLVIVLGLIWEFYARWLDAPLLFPTLIDTVDALCRSLASGRIEWAVLTSMQVLLLAYAAGLVLATLLTTLAVSTQVGRDLIWTLTTAFNPLPAIALLPLALLWFGIGMGAIVFVVIHSVLWPVALSMYSGFLSVSETQRLVGQNCGLRGMRYVNSILIPAALPSIVSGMKIGWAFAWRTLIAAELIFGVSTGSGGLGWFIYQYRADLRTNYVFAGLLMVIIIGLAVEGLIFHPLEKRTLRRWGMQR